MGTTMSFYLIQNQNVSQEIWKERMKQFQSKLSAQNRVREEHFGLLLSSFLDKERFEEIKDQMKQESPDTFDFASRFLKTLQKENEKEPLDEKVVPFPGMPRPAEEQGTLWGKRAVLAYRPDAKWLPLFEENLCEGYNASSRDAGKLAKTFGAPVLAFSIFDSDILFVSYAAPEKGISVDYAKPNFEGFEEYDMDQYQEAFPQFLCVYGEETALRDAWKGEEVFADDRMAKLCELIGAQVLYDSSELPQGFQWIE